MQKQNPLRLKKWENYPQDLESWNKSIKELEDIKTALDQTSIVAITDTQGVITYVNDKFCELSGYRREELIGRTHRLFKSGYHSQEFYRNLWNTIQRGEIWKGEINNRSKNGSSYWSFMTVVPFTDFQGKPYQYVSIRTDITALKKIEEEQIRLLESESARIRAEEAVQARDRFVSMAAHELKTPITSLQLLLEMLLKQGNPDPQALKMLESAAFQTKRLTTLINDMLDVSRIAGGKLKLNIDRVNLTELINNLLSSFQEDFKLAHCDVSFESSEQVQGFWDQSRIEQVIINLLTNSMKYGKGQPIQVIVTQNQDQAQIQVVDHGIGIPLEFQEHLFERFERSKTAENFHGIGLGLWISKQIVIAHQGKISVKSTLGSGATFLVELPKALQSNP